MYVFNCKPEHKIGYNNNNNYTFCQHKPSLENIQQCVLSVSCVCTMWLSSDLTESDVRRVLQRVTSFGRGHNTEADRRHRLLSVATRKTISCTVHYIYST